MLQFSAILTKTMNKRQQICGKLCTKRLHDIFSFGPTSVNSPTRVTMSRESAIGNLVTSMADVSVSVVTISLSDKSLHQLAVVPSCLGFAVDQW
ncbi:hypothetical protein J6590_078315 [Homalodisca vitripennis]|nr:hypothetical protein J6590_078315 [Homalodisca vitripennis]